MLLRRRRSSVGMHPIANTQHNQHRNIFGPFLRVCPGGARRTKSERPLAPLVPPTGPVSALFAAAGKVAAADVFDPCGKCGAYIGTRPVQGERSIRSMMARNGCMANLSCLLRDVPFRHGWNSCRWRKCVERRAQRGTHPRQRFGQTTVEPRLEVSPAYNEGSTATPGKRLLVLSGCGRKQEAR